MTLPWNQFYNAYNTWLTTAYPAISALSEPWQNRSVISPYHIFLPQSVIDSMAEAVSHLFRLSRQHAYREAVRSAPIDREILSSPAANLSVLMAYDFHLDGETPRLLEINTNASGYLLADALYHMHAQPNPFPQAMHALKQSFAEEFQRLGLEGSPHIAIIDEAPRAQKMFPEFLLYQSLFETWGYTASNMITSTSPIAMAHSSPRKRRLISFTIAIVTLPLQLPLPKNSVVRISVVPVVSHPIPKSIYFSPTSDASCR
jgi:hypothetical protein